jgi:hypothetical protein
MVNIMPIPLIRATLTTFFLIAFAGSLARAQQVPIPPTLAKDLNSPAWPVRRDAFETLIADPHALDNPAVREAIIRLREKENTESGKAEPDLFEDDDYLAYDEQLGPYIKKVAQTTHSPRAWSALVHERYNSDSPFGRWLATQREALPALTDLLDSRYISYRADACYVILAMLANAKINDPFPAAVYRRYKDRIRWHILHDNIIVVFDGIEGLALTKDADDIPLLKIAARQAPTAFHKKHALDTVDLIAKANHP